MFVEEIRDNLLLRQFEAKTNIGLISMEYAIQEKKVFLTKLSANENEEELAINDFIITVLNIIEERKCKVVPTNAKIISFFRKNKKYQDLLPPGIKY